MTNVPLFLPPTPILTLPKPHKQSCAPQMSTKGFGKTPPPRPASQNQQRRDQASQRYDEMAASGMPEYTIWMRLKTGGTLSAAATEGKEATEEEQMPWLPVGCIAVPRSGSVARALKDAEDDLWQGAERLYPKLKGEERSNVEFGSQLRQFPDEEIRLVEDAGEEGGVGGWVKRFFGKLQNPLNVG